MTTAPIDRTTIRRLIGVEPREISYYHRALTHSSVQSNVQSGNNSSNSKAVAGDYERLEFLGDRLLGLAIAAELLARFPNESEGLLSQRLHILVSGEVCAHIARALGLPALVQLGRQALANGERNNDNIAADVIESLIGAIYLDLGFDIARAFVLRHWQPQISSQTTAPQHPKAALQEWAAAQKQPQKQQPMPRYQILSQNGPDHARCFHIKVQIGEDPSLCAEAKGTTKKEAETAAAKKLLTQIAKQTPKQDKPPPDKTPPLG